MVLLALVTIAAGVAVPAFAGGSVEDDFRDYVNQLATDLRRARFEALSGPRAHSILLRPAGHWLVTPTVGVGGTVRAKRSAPDHVVIAGVLDAAAWPQTRYLPQRGVLPAEIRCTPSSHVEIQLGGGVGRLPPSPGSATVFLTTDDQTHRARIVVSEPTARVRVYWTW